MLDGRPRASMVRVDFDGEHVLINTMLERQKGRNMRANPRVTLLVVDPEDTSRWIEVRELVAEMTPHSAEPHADRLLQRYSSNRKQHFYRDVYPVAQRQGETHIIVRIVPTSLSLDAIFR